MIPPNTFSPGQHSDSALGIFFFGTWVSDFESLPRVATMTPSGYSWESACLAEVLRPERAKGSEFVHVPFRLNVSKTGGITFKRVLNGPDHSQSLSPLPSSIRPLWNLLIGASILDSQGPDGEHNSDKPQRYWSRQEP